MKYDYPLTNILIKDAGLCNHLLNSGFLISNVTRNRFAQGTVFYFKPADGIQNAIEKYSKDYFLM